jgi:hypothetical protein
MWMQEVFIIADEDGSGRLDFSEFKAVLSKVGFSLLFVLLHAL